MVYNRWQDLSRRVAAMHVFWQEAIADLTLDQVNYQERAGVLPITFSLFHYVQGEDRNVAERLLDRPSLWESGEWAAKTGIQLESIRRGAPMEVAETVRLTDLDAWRRYQTEVFALTDRTLPGVSDDRWNEVLFPRVPDAMKGGFAAHLAGDGPVYFGDLMDVFLYQHGMRHLGEIEHARSLVGFQGVG